MYTFLKYSQPTIHTTLAGDALGLLWPIGCSISETVSGNKLISSQMRNKKHERNITTSAEIHAYKTRTSSYVSLKAHWENTKLTPMSPA